MATFHSMAGGGTEENCLLMVSHFRMKYTCFFSSCTVSINALTNSTYTFWTVLNSLNIHYIITRHHRIFQHRCWIIFIMWSIVKKLLKGSVRSNCLKTPDKWDHNLSNIHNWALLGTIYINLCVSRGASTSLKKQSHTPTQPLAPSGSSAPSFSPKKM